MAPPPFPSLSSDHQVAIPPPPPPPLPLVGLSRSLLCGEAVLKFRHRQGPPSFSHFLGRHPVMNSGMALTLAPENVYSIFFFHLQVSRDNS